MVDKEFELRQKSLARLRKILRAPYRGVYEPVRPSVLPIFLGGGFLGML